MRETGACMKRAAASILVLVLAGCVSTTEDGALPPTESSSAAVSPAFAALAVDLADVPCSVPTVSRTSTSGNVEVVADVPVENPVLPRTLAEIDRQEGLLVQAFYTDQGFRLLNISDPREPVEVGSYVVQAGSDTYDVKFSNQGPLVIVGFVDRLHLIDVSDPAKPVRVSELLHPAEYRGQAHMVFPHVVDGVEYVFVTPSVSGTGLLVAKITGNGSHAKLELVRVYTSTGPHAVFPQALAPHDTFAEYDRTYGHHVLYLANSFNGVVIMNIDDPADAVPIASLPGTQAPPPTGAAPNHYHTIQSTWIGEKRVFATVSEVGYNTLKIFDATDIENPTFMGEWVYDRNQPANLQHNFQIVDGKIFMAHYERGLFVFDLAAFVSAPSGVLPEVAHYQPPPGGLLWDVILWDGVLFVSDIPQGLHVLGYGCFEPGNPRFTSRG